MLKVVSVHGEALRYASSWLRSDKEVVLAAVSSNSFAVRYASFNLRADKDVIRAAVTQDGRTLAYASDELKGDKDIVLAAVAHTAGALRYLKSTRAFVQQHSAQWQNPTMEDIFALKSVIVAELAQFSLKEILDNVTYEVVEDLANSNQLPELSKWIVAPLNHWLTIRSKVLKALTKLSSAHKLTKKQASAVPMVENSLKTEIGERIYPMVGDELARFALVALQGKVTGMLLDGIEDSELIAWIQDSHGHTEAISSRVREALKVLEESDMLTEDQSVAFASRSVADGDHSPAATTPRASNSNRKNDKGRGKEATTSGAISNGTTGVQQQQEWDGNGRRPTVTDDSYASPLLADKEVVLTAVRQVGTLLSLAAPELRADKEVVLSAAASNAEALYYAANSLFGDKEVVLVAVACDGSLYKRASTELKADVEVALAALKNSFEITDVLDIAPDNVKADKKFMLAAIAFGPSLLQYASDELKREKDFLRAVCECWSRSRFGASAFKYLPSEAMQDKEMALTAVAHCGLALKYASDELKADSDCVLAAVQQQGASIQYASKELRADRAVVLAAVQQSGVALEYGSEEPRADRAVVLAAVQQSGLALEYASKELRADRAVVLAAVQQSGMALKYASEQLKGDTAVVLAAVQRRDGRALKYASEQLQADKAFICRVVKINANTLYWLSKELSTDKAVGLAIVQNNGTFFGKLSVELRADREVVLAAMQNSATAIEKQEVLSKASEDLQWDEELVAMQEQN